MKLSIHDEKTFYKEFIKDLENAVNEVIIIVPFILAKRMVVLFPIFENLVKRGVKVVVVTRPPEEYKKKFQKQGENQIQYFERIGVQVLINKNDNRKLSLIDRKISWEGSLNILSQVKSRDVMIRIEDSSEVKKLFDFLNLATVI